MFSMPKVQKGNGFLTRYRRIFEKNKKKDFKIGFFLETRG
jgi:hypothetical protein